MNSPHTPPSDSFSDAPSPTPLIKITETLTVLAYRLATYSANNLIDDPAMLAMIFC